MKTNFKALALMLLIISSSVFICCNDEFEEKDGDGRKLKNDENFDGEICNGKKILSFNTLADLQQEHLNLYNQYMLNNEVEQVLVDYENTNDFYSLRKKEQDMDEGIIPDDPTFDETNFTFDPVFETLLNEDGMIIIGERLYLWDSGCIIHSIPFSCSNYENLFNFYYAVKNNSSDAMHSIFINNNMTNINTCDDGSYDFETISENGGRGEGRKPRVQNKNGCGYEVVVNSDLQSCVDGWNTYKISYQEIIPLGASNPLRFFYLDTVIGELDQIEISGDGLFFTSLDLSQLDPSLGYLVPFSEEFYMRIPDGVENTVSIYFNASVNLLNGNSCMSSDTIFVNNLCPFSIEAILNSADQTGTTWTFTLAGSNGCVIPGDKVNWNFGDGTSMEAGFTVEHQYTVCKAQGMNVTATIDGFVCGTMNKVFMKTVPVTSCTRDNYTFPTHKETYDGKKVTLRAKIKRDNMTGKSIFKNVFKYRKDGHKTIKSIGNIYKPNATNTSCIQSGIASVLPEKTTQGKKRNKQKEKYATIYVIKGTDPYEVKFTHTNGYNHTLTASDLFCP